MKPKLATVNLPVIASSGRPELPDEANLSGNPVDNEVASARTSQ